MASKRYCSKRIQRKSDPVKRIAFLFLSESKRVSRILQWLILVLKSEWRLFRIGENLIDYSAFFLRGVHEAKRHAKL